MNPGAIGGAFGLTGAFLDRSMLPVCRSRAADRDFRRLVRSVLAACSNGSWRCRICPGRTAAPNRPRNRAGGLDHSSLTSRGVQAEACQIVEALHVVIDRAGGDNADDIRLQGCATGHDHADTDRALAMEPLEVLKIAVKERSLLFHSISRAMAPCRFVAHGRSREKSRPVRFRRPSSG